MKMINIFKILPFFVVEWWAKKYCQKDYGILFNTHKRYFVCPFKDVYFTFRGK
jgi:hypothetical protein